MTAAAPNCAAWDRFESVLGADRGSDRDANAVASGDWSRGRATLEQLLAVCERLRADDIRASGYSYARRDLRDLDLATRMDEARTAHQMATPVGSRNAAAQVFSDAYHAVRDLTDGAAADGNLFSDEAKTAREAAEQAVYAICFSAHLTDGEYQALISPLAAMDTARRARETG